MKTILITGGAGFIGSHLCEFLLDKGYRVIAMDNLITGNRENIKHLESNPNFKFIEQDVGDELEDLEVDQIYHLASPASPNKNNPQSYISHPFESDKNPYGYASQGFILQRFLRSFERER